MIPQSYMYSTVTNNKMRIKLLVLMLSFVLVKTDNSFLDIFQFQSVMLPDLRSACLGNNFTNVSEKCGEQFKALCQNETVLLTMFDAWSKVHPGLLYASKRDLGNFDECITIDYKYEGGRILGEYCAAGIVIPNVSGNSTDLKSMYTLAVCRPDACSASDLNAILANAIENSSLPLFQDMFCQTAETGTEITATDRVTITIFVSCILVMILSSTYDFYLYKKQLSCPNQLYLAFSVMSNGRKLLQVTKNSKEQIYSFQGIRAISIMWVIAGHGFPYWEQYPISNVPTAEEWKHKWYAGYINTAPVAVDTFFFMSGFLIAYQYLKQKPKPLRDHITSIPQLYMHRYIRLTPVLLMAFLVTISVMSHMGSGPMWFAAMNILADPCRKYWWSYFLYIQNYYNFEATDMCIGLTWFLSADMQMFLLSPLVLIPITLQLRRSAGLKLSMIALLLLNLFFAFLPMVIKLTIGDNNNRYDTHSRLIDYFIGLMLGIFMRVARDKPFLYMISSPRKSLMNFIAWIFTLLGMMILLICFHYVRMHSEYVGLTVFTSLLRPAWCIALSWIVYSCYHGYGGIVNWILCRPIFQVLGKLTYCMYIMHWLVQFFYMGTVRERLYFSDYAAFYLFCGHYIVTVIVSLFWTLAFESPLIVIEKVILGEGNKKKRNELSKYDNTEGEPRKVKDVA